MSIIDEIIGSHRAAIEQATDILTQYGHKLTTEETNGLQGGILTHEDCIKELETLSPYVELGETIVRKNELLENGTMDELDFAVAWRDVWKKEKELLTQIREQENGTNER